MCIFFFHEIEAARVFACTGYIVVVEFVTYRKLYKLSLSAQQITLTCATPQYFSIALLFYSLTHMCTINVISLKEH